eukprot:2006745-Amphidinium_carterae.1
MQQSHEHPSDTKAQVLEKAPPPAPMPIEQSELVTDIFDKHFRDIDQMDHGQILSKLQELQATLPMD